MIKRRQNCQVMAETLHLSSSPYGRQLVPSTPDEPTRLGDAESMTLKVTRRKSSAIRVLDLVGSPYIPGSMLMSVRDSERAGRNGCSPIVRESQTIPIT